MDTPVSSTNKTDSHGITEILLKVAINPTSHSQTLSHNVVTSTPLQSGIQTHNVSGDRH
jgi:hypothetical protein